MANSIQDALKKERDIKPEECWVDEKQPDPVNTTQIGFDLKGGKYYYSPYMKRKRKKK